MWANFRKSDSLVSIVNGVAIDLATPSNISRWWNFGFMLFICLFMQIVSGLLLSMDFTGTVEAAFGNMSHIIMDMSNGWFLRNWHASGASLFFVLIYSHMGRGMFYGSFNLKVTWLSGVSMLLCLMATAFLGYVLPWGQMSFWGATVITNLFSAAPLIGSDLVQYLWGGFSVDSPTLKRFFALHFLLPFVLLFLGALHVFFLHETGSNNPLGIGSASSKLQFYPYSALTDAESMVNLLMYFIVLIFMGYLSAADDPDNFMEANPLMAPPHIQPEWYFLFAYAILRSIPNKLGGVIALVMAVLVLYSLPFTTEKKFLSSKFNPVSKFLFFNFVGVAILLTWIGARPVEPPYVLVGQVLTILYFSYFVFSPMVERN